MQYAYRFLSVLRSVYIYIYIYIHKVYIRKVGQLLANHGHYVSVPCNVAAGVW